MHDINRMGARSVFLLNTFENVPELPVDAESFDFKMNKTAVPVNRTTYMYRVFEFPDLSGRHDIVQIDPIVQAGNEGVVHHMILYECGDNFPQIHVDFEGKTNSPDMPPPVLQCIGLSIITAWAIGGQSFYYPEHVGLSFEGHPKFAVMEMH